MREPFAKQGVTYRLAEQSKSDLYQAFLPLLTSARVQLLDHGKLVAQLCALERRRVSRGGKDSIDHPPGGHDDIANSVAGVSVLVAARRRGIEFLEDTTCLS